MSSSDNLEYLSSMLENMHGIVNLDAVSALLQGLLQQIVRQNVVMKNMQEQINHMVTQQDHQEVVRRLEDKISLLEAGVIKAQKAATANLLDQQ